jgi:phosphoglycolate phosphatase
VKKPHPAHVLGTIEMLGGRPTRAVMIGDSSADAEAARGAGVGFIAVSFGYGEPMEELRPDAVIDGYGELVPAVRQIVLRS